MAQERNRNVNEADAQQSEHERKVAEIEKRRAVSPSDDAILDEGRRPTSGEDVAADRTRDEDDEPASSDPPPR